MTRAEQAARERVRMQAAALFERGESISKVAAVLRVGVRQVEKWHSAWVKGGGEALRSKGPQSTPRLSEEQFARLELELLRGPACHGWDVDQRWTLARIVTMTRRLFRISYTPVRNIGVIAPQRVDGAGPATAGERAGRRGRRDLGERDLAAGKSAAAARGARLCFEDETGQGLRPPKGRTWCRHGQTPIVHVRGGGTGRVNIAGLVCYRSGDRSRLIYRIRVWRGRKGESKALTWTDYRDLLMAAHQQLHGSIVLVWDNLNMHKAPQLQESIDEYADWLTVFYLPAYSPDLNPAEGIWSMLKASLTNFAANDMNHLVRTVRRHLKRIQYRASLVDGCLTQTGLITNSS